MGNIILKQYKLDFSQKQTLVYRNKIILLIYILFLVIVKVGIKVALILVIKLASKSEEDT